MELLVATQNPNKVKEISSKLNLSVQVMSLVDLNFMEEIPETSDTLEGNALQKARFTYERFGKNCFADDTGLEIDALNGEPGVFSARYAGEQKSSKANIKKVLSRLKDSDKRSARFRTVIALILNDEEKLFEGVVEGTITQEIKGDSGFGYDPIFIPNGHSITFAEMSLEEKNKISHRAKAVEKLVDYLNTYD